MTFCLTRSATFTPGIPAASTAQATSLLWLMHLLSLHYTAACPCLQSQPGSEHMHCPSLLQHAWCRQLGTPDLCIVTAVTLAITHPSAVWQNITHWWLNQVGARLALSLRNLQAMLAYGMHASHLAQPLQAAHAAKPRHSICKNSRAGHWRHNTHQSHHCGGNKERHYLAAPLPWTNSYLLGIADSAQGNPSTSCQPLQPQALGLCRGSRLRPGPTKGACTVQAG